MKKRNIIEDDHSIELPQILHDDYYELNSQSAYNRRLVEEAFECGCFYCGSRFAGSEVTEWLKEDDGEDTALCPYCGVDAVIVGTTRQPLSTLILSVLYEYWFREERDKKAKNYTYSPTYSGYTDYLRKGVPFRLEYDESLEFVGKITIWSPAAFAAALNKAYGIDESADPKKYEFADAGGVVSVRAYFNEDNLYECEIIDEYGNRLPYEPFRGKDQGLLLELTEEYGDSLRGVMSHGSKRDWMRLFVKEKAFRLWH